MVIQLFAIFFVFTHLTICHSYIYIYIYLLPYLFVLTTSSVNTQNYVLSQLKVRLDHVR